MEEGDRYTERERERVRCLRRKRFLDKMQRMWTFLKGNIEKYINIMVSTFSAFMSVVNRDAQNCIPNIFVQYVFYF